MNRYQLNIYTILYWLCLAVERIKEYYDEENHAVSRETLKKYPAWFLLDTFFVRMTFCLISE